MMLYEKVHVLVHYACGHDAIRAELIGTVGRRERWTYERCAHCAEMHERRYELKAEQERAAEEGVAV